jgi:hypothetical protein
MIETYLLISELFIFSWFLVSLMTFFILYNEAKGKTSKSSQFNKILFWLKNINKAVLFPIKAVPYIINIFFLLDRKTT